LQKLRRNLPEGVTVQLFSSLNGMGVEEARARLREVLETPGTDDEAPEELTNTPPID